MTSSRELLYHCTMENTLYWQLFELNHQIAGLWCGHFLAVGCNKTYDGGVNLHKFPKEIKDSRQLSLSMFWSPALVSGGLDSRGSNSLEGGLLQV